MGFAKHLMATPAAMVGTAARGNQRDRALAMMLAPHPDVLVQVNGISCRAWLGIEIPDLFAGRSTDDLTVISQKGDALHLARCPCGPGLQDGNQLLEREFPFANDDNVGTRFEVLADIGTWLGTSH